MIVLLTKKSLCFLLILVLVSCTERNTNSTELLTDTIQNSKAESTSTAKSDSDADIQSGLNRELTPEEKERMERMIERDKNEEEMKKLYGPGYTSGNEIEITESKILYDADFKPYLLARVKNNLTINLIALDVIVWPKCNTQSNYEPLHVRKKITIKPNQIVIVKEKLKELDECILDNAKINLGDCIMSNGKKLSMGDFFRNIESY